MIRTQSQNIHFSARRSQLRNLLQYVQQEIEGSPRLELPLELDSHDIHGYNDIIRVTALLVDDVMFIVMTIPLKYECL